MQHIQLCSLLGCCLLGKLIWEILCLLKPSKQTRELLLTLWSKNFSGNDSLHSTTSGMTTDDNFLYPKHLNRKLQRCPFRRSIICSIGRNNISDISHHKDFPRIGASN